MPAIAAVFTSSAVRRRLLTSDSLRTWLPGGLIASLGAAGIAVRWTLPLDCFAVFLALRTAIPSACNVPLLRLHRTVAASAEN